MLNKICKFLSALACEQLRITYKFVIYKNISYTGGECNNTLQYKLFFTKTNTFVLSWLMNEQKEDKVFKKCYWGKHSVKFNLSLVHFVTAIQSATVLLDSDMYRYIREYLCMYV